MSKRRLAADSLNNKQDDSLLGGKIVSMHFSLLSLMHRLSGGADQYL